MFEVESYDVKSSLVDKLCKNKTIELTNTDIIPDTGNFINLKTSKGQSVLAHISGEETLSHVHTKDINFQGFTPRDQEQHCYFWSLKNKQLTMCLGAAGTGKTSIALAYAINRLFKDDMKIILCKPTVFVGSKSNAIAAVPGDERDKLAPYVDSFMPGLKRILGEDAQHFLYEWEENGMLEFRAVELMRGQHFDNSVVIIDEAQNLSLHELASIVSRIAETSTIIILGDPAQIDTGEKWNDTGLYLFGDSHAVHDSEFCGLIKLVKQYRGPLAKLCSEVLAEYNPLEEDDFIFAPPIT